MLSFSKILAIAPHTDDIELACGGSINRFVTVKSDLYYTALSDCRDTLAGTKFPEDTTNKECRSALKILGIKSKNIFIYQHTNKHYAQEARSIFETLEKLRERIKPDLVIIPDRFETHQDHETVARQAISVFRRSTSILCYEQPWNAIDFTPNFFMPLTKKEMETKFKALQSYRSQAYFKRPYFSRDFIYAAARMRGNQINEEYAEAFRVVKLIG